MFQQYFHPASCDPSAVAYEHVSQGGVLFSYAPQSGNNAAYFAAPSATTVVTVGNLDAAPRNSLLALNIGTTSDPTFPAFAYVVFWSGETFAGKMPVAGNGISFAQDALVIPEGADKAEITTVGFGNWGGHVRIVDRETVPYQPLKG